MSKKTAQNTSRDAEALTNFSASHTAPLVPLARIALVPHTRTPLLVLVRLHLSLLPSPVVRSNLARTAHSLLPASLFSFCCCHIAQARFDVSSSSRPERQQRSRFLLPRRHFLCCSASSAARRFPRLPLRLAALVVMAVCEFMYFGFF